MNQKLKGNEMKGQFSNDEMIRMSNIISSVNQLSKGYIVRQVGKTVNYYRQHSDGSWTNYNCRTV